MDIICRERSCVFNKGFFCSNNKIIIDKNSNCTSYKKNDLIKPLPNTSNDIFSKTPPKYHSHKKSKDYCINCSADCLFKTNKICESNGITINTIQNKPTCVSFFKK